MSLSEDLINRYSRHIILEGMGGDGQEKIVNSKVLIIGLGGLGSPVAIYLSSCGAGTIGLVDNDVVDLNNLQRKIIHFTNDIDKLKIDSAKEKINKLNPNIKIKTYKEYITPLNVLEIIKDYDFIVDCTDNFTSKFLINDACVLAKKPYSHGGLLKFSGQAMTVIPHETACYRCMFNEPPPQNAIPTCSQTGVFGILPGIIGSIQAAEAVKYIAGIDDLIINRLLIVDALTMEFRNVKVNRNKNCTVCGENPKITSLLE